MSDASTLTSDRFVIKDKLGAGGMGVVYRAYDRERELDVALKTLRTIDGPQLYRFKKEFRGLAEIVHPNLVTLYELLTVGGEWFFTMELVEGVSFLEWVRPHNHLRMLTPTPVSGGSRRNEDTRTMPTVVTGPDGTVGLRRCLKEASLRADRLGPAVRQLTDAVHAIHSASKLHRDIKPSNVLVTASGRVVLCDFGLIAEAREAERTIDGSTVGTPSYMAPEQAMADRASIASDWYSVGVMLYEAVAGALPFVGSYQEVLQRKQHEDPPPPRALDPSVPREIDALCCALLRRDPAQRAGRDAIARVFSAGADPAPAPAAPVADAAFVGRAHHLESLQRAYRDSRAGHGVAVFVHGLSGMGKSSLVTQFLRRVADAGGDAVVLRGRCYERESVPYKALDSLVDALSSFLLTCSDAEMDYLTPPDVVALSRLFPVLRRVRAIAEPRVRGFEPPDPLESRRRGFAALRELLGRLSANRPVVLCIDDLQWGDVDSAPFLIDLIHHPEAPHALLIGSYRREDVDSSPLLKALLRPQSARGDVRELPVDALTDAEAIEIATGILGASDADRVAAIVRESGRSPMFLAELAYAGKAAQSTEALSLDDVVRRRVAALPADARALLTASAVAGRPVPVVVASRAAGVSDEAAALRVLTNERLVRTRQVRGRHEIEPYHDRIREAVVDSLDDEARRSAHEAIAEAIEKSDRSDLQALVDHWLEAGNREKAGRYAARAAVQAERALAFDRAAHYFGLALELQELPPDKRLARQQRMASALANAGRLLDAADQYLAAAAHAPAEQKLELRRNAVEQLLHGGRLEQGLEVTKLVLDEVGLRLPRSSRSALLSVVWRRAWLRLRGLKFKQRREREVPAEVLRKLDVCWSTSSGLSFVDPMLGKAYQMRHLLDALSAGEPVRISLAFSLELGYLALAGGKTKAQVEELYERNMGLAQRINHPHAIGMNHGVAGLARFLAGHWAEALERIKKGEQILLDQCEGVRWELGLIRIFRASALLYLGRIRELTDQVAVMLREALDRGDQYAANGLRAWRANVTWLALDDPTEARRQALEGALESAQDDFHLHHYYEMLTHAQIELYQRDASAAWNRVSGRWGKLKRSMLLRIQSVRIEGAFLRARCALARAAAGHDRDAMLADAERCAKLIEKEREAWGMPLAGLVRATVAAQRGQLDEVPAALERVARAFDDADMSLFSRVAQRQRGLILGGDEGRALVRACETWMREQAIKNPERMAEMYAPGFVR